MIGRFKILPTVTVMNLVIYCTRILALCAKLGFQFLVATI
jgi:hypothetical protein